MSRWKKADFSPGEASAPSFTIELSISCRDLTDMDVFSKSDPFCVLYLKDTHEVWNCLGRTETIDNTLNPEFQKKFILDYKFEERQLLKFDVYDADSDSPRLEDHDFIGSTQCSLGEVVACQGRAFTKPLIGDGGNHRQVLCLTAEELLENKEVLHLSMGARKLDRKNWWGWGSSDPFLTISKAMENGTWVVVHRTEVVMRDLCPSWAALSLPISSLCGGDRSRGIKFTVEDWNKSGDHEHIGQVTTSVADLVEKSRSGPIEFNLIDQTKAKKAGLAKYSGVLLVKSCSLEAQDTFLDFITSGTELSFTVAVDFTGSNGNPSDPRSLHYNDPTGAPNQYVTAIRAVGDIIQDYDSDKMFPALGFGARVPPEGRVSHEFFLNLSSASPYCAGVEGILGAYYSSLRQVQLYGPTNFSPVIRHVAQFARAYQSDPSNYFILLIITDGIITDLEATKAAVIEASTLPMSIIIVGVGTEADFSAMDELDSDDALLEQGGKTASRDIVQFVEMAKFLRGGQGTQWNKEMLAKEVLLEIPEQLVGYMKSKNFKPLNSVDVKPRQPAASAPYLN